MPGLSGRVSLRPHIKTHKTLEIGRMQCGSDLGATEGSIVTSTMAESHAFAQDRFFREVYYAIPISLEKLHQAWQITRHMSETGNRRFCIEVDSLQSLDMVKRFLADEEVQGPEVFFHVFVKVDVGQHREGVDPDSDEAVELVKGVVQTPQLRFRGIYAHGGHSYHTDDVLSVAKQEALVTARFARRLLDDHGITCEVVSIGSTPTVSALMRAASADSGPDTQALEWFPEEITEIHPGNYVFYDRMQVQMGSCEMSNVAVCVLATVVGQSRERNTLLIDAGSLAMFKDTGVDDINSPDFSYGHVIDDPHLRLIGMSQELGTLHSSHTPIDFERFAVGTVLRIIPNHSCLTAAMYPVYHVVDNMYDKEEGKVCLSASRYYLIISHPLTHACIHAYIYIGRGSVFSFPWLVRNMISLVVRVDISIRLFLIIQGFGQILFQRNSQN